ncbi:MAG: hypothetical protein PHY47_03940 [Lachnospiraceae bacterium]|nr:hypothetical protein [Lachnospiraceae bacterium]
MKIDSSMPSFYNASSKINSMENRNSVLATLQNTDLKTQVSIHNEESNRDQSYKGVRQTKVASDNAYQKLMITDPRFAAERMASKLLDKLPVILDDMKNLSDVTYLNETSIPAENSKIVISENSKASYGGDVLKELQDISL